MTPRPRRKQKPVRWLPLPPPLPNRYCPRCERKLEGPDPAFHMIYDCTTCEKLLFESETDSYPGETKGKPRPEQGESK